ncbi:MAG TPA: aminodeoxychorismate synthase component I [Tepidisphaeraceae bacterium]
MRWDADHPLILDRPEMYIVGGPTYAEAVTEYAELRFDHLLEPLSNFGFGINGSAASTASLTTATVGYFGYDLGRQFESLPVVAADDRVLPLYAIAQVDASGARGSRRAATPQASPNDVRPQAAAARQEPRPPVAPVSTFTRDDYIAAVTRCREYIAAGDIFQVNLSQRFKVRISEPPRVVFDRMQAKHPADFPAYLDFGDFQILSNSPELFLDVRPLPDGRRRIVNRPIKGTRPRQPGMEQALRDSEKDKAELAMIVDLQRNDLGRICEIGSVKVTQPRSIEAHPTVYHGVATIEGILRPEVTLLDILRATFPCGSITGCPKIRAMEIIEELEPVRRGPYCGAIGWIGPDGSMQLSVAIRTMVIQNGYAYVSVGGGIVADSVPEEEYNETLVKAQAMFEALGVELPPLIA